MNSQESIQITAEVTPNPNTLKFNVNRVLLDSGSLNFPDKAKAAGSALPEGLFGIENVLGVMIGRDFITVTKMPAVDWQNIAPAIANKIRAMLASNEVLFTAQDKQVAASSGGGANSEIEKKIREILDNEIRPAVAMDGGDITFYGYQDGVVTLHLQGSCSSCPSSIMTLKMGVENRLKQVIPQVKEVVQI